MESCGQLSHLLSMACLIWQTSFLLTAKLQCSAHNPERFKCCCHLCSTRCSAQADAMLKAGRTAQLMPFPRQAATLMASISGTCDR